LPQGFWVQVGEFDSLDAAYAMLCTSAFRDQSARVLSYFSPAIGLRFALILNKFFADEPAAELAASRLPQPLRSRASVRNQWPADAVYFTVADAWDPRTGKKRVLAATH